MTTVPPPSAPKKRKIGETSSTGASGTLDMAIVTVASAAKTIAGKDDPHERESTLLPREFERLVLTVNPDFVDKLRSSRTVGFERLATTRIAAPRYYEINIENLRSALTDVTERYLTIKLNEQQILTYPQVTAEVTTMTPIIVNACFAALYAKLRTIHKQFQRYATRFPVTPSYARDIELPLPFADAIQNFGVFTPLGIEPNYLCVPVYPEGIQNEGRSTQTWQSFSYEAFVPYLKSLGIPLKSVDTRLKVGSPWWTYKVEFADDHFDLRCIFPPSNYSDHSALLASIFMRPNAPEDAANMIINHLDDDVEDYPVRMRELPDGFQLRAFSALCHAPREEWNQYLLIK